MIQNRDTEAPLLLSARVNVLANGTAVADSAALSSPIRRPYVIDEIRFTASAAITAVGSAPGVNWGGFIRAKLSLGRIPLTNGFIYIWLFGTAINSEMTVQPEVGGVSPTTRWTFAHFRWKLPKPLYIPVGQTLTCEILRDADPITPAFTTEGTNNSVTVDIGYTGRYLKPTADVPSVLEVPYVTQYLPPVNAGAAHSSENDLVNPFLMPINIQRMIGRLRFVSTSTGLGETTENGDLTTPVVQIRDSWGHNVLNDFTPFLYVFHYPRRAWTFHRILEPKERYNVILRDIPTQPPLTAPEEIRPMISIVGWREELMR